MAAQPTIDQLTNLSSESSAVAKINSNLNKLSAAFGNCLSTTTAPGNTMSVPLDMNNNRFLNVPGPSSDIDVARLKDVKSELARALSGISFQQGSTATSRANRVVDIMVDFGAKGDGITNDSPYIQAAIDDVASRGGGKIFVPPRIFGIGTPLIMRKGVYIQGCGHVPPYDTAAPTMRNSAFQAIASISSMITQADLNNPLHSWGLSDLLIDAGKSNGLTVANCIMVSGINSRVQRCYIRNGTGNGYYNKTNPIASWINWVQDNYIEFFDNACLRWEGTDSYITNNYVSSGQSFCMYLDATGGNQIVGNMLDAAGRNTAGVYSNVNAVAMFITCRSQLAQYGAASTQMITGNHFGENAQDMWFEDIGQTVTAGHVVTGNLFNNCQNNSITIGNNNFAGVITGNIFRYMIKAGSGCVVFLPGGTQSTQGFWSLGPNSFSFVSAAKYVNPPTSTVILGIQ